MRLQSLATLTAVVAHGSLAAAAEQVNLTPSAVSLQMKQLEAYFGQPLFDRSGRQVRPTAFALELARTVERAVAEIEAMRHRPDRAPTGRVRLGITESAQTTLLPRAFADLQQRAPGVSLQIERGVTTELLQELKAGRVDVAVLIRPATGGSSRLHWTHLMSEELVLVVPADVRSNDVAKVLRERRWIRLVAGQMAARFVDGLVPHCQALVDVPGIDAIVAMVGAGIGVSVLPRLRREHLSAHAVRQISLGRRTPVRQMTLVRRNADAENPLLDAVQAAFLRAAAELQG